MRHQKKLAALEYKIGYIFKHGMRVEMKGVAVFIRAIYRQVKTRRERGHSRPRQ
jgi:hypothetical protein